MSLLDSIKNKISQARAGSGDPNDINTIPTGGAGATRRLNKLPAVLFITLVLLMALILIYSVTTRHQQASTQTKEKQVSIGAQNNAAEITAGRISGYIPARTPAVPETKPEPKPDLPEPPPMVPEPDPSPAPRETHRMPTDLEMQIWQRRLQQYQQAMTARTSAPVGSNINMSSGGGGRQSASERPRGVNHETADYQQKLAQLRQRSSTGGGGGGGGATSRIASDIDLNPDAKGNNLANYDRNNRWGLGNRVEDPDTQLILHTGFVIPAIMISGINSDLPGQVIAQVSQNVYDSITGRNLLIPQGTRLIGTYNATTAFGQDRLFMVWQRLLFPDGRTLDIGAMPGTDAMGQAGFEDKVDHHYLRIFGSAILLSGVIAGVSLSQDTGDDRDDSGNRARNALSQSLGSTLGNSMSQMLNRYMNISPTIQIRPGYRMNVMVVRDIRFNRPYRAFDY